MTSEIALFPLNHVLYPGSELPLRVFELRYRRMLDLCGRQRPFGVVRIRFGNEVGDPAFPYDVGCAGYLVDRIALPDGSLAIQVVGDRRFRIESLRVEDDGLTMAKVSWLPPDPPVPVPPGLKPVAESFAEVGDPPDSAGMLAWRLAEALPLTLDDRQELLEEDDPGTRLQWVQAWLRNHPGDFSA